MLQIYGDSITAGVPGVSYCHYFRKDMLFKNYGVGGDTVFGLLNRVVSAKIDKNDEYIIEIGTNDIMLPYLWTISKKWESTVSTIEQSGRNISKSIIDFADTYDKLLKTLEFNKVGIISIPCIGENTESHINAIVDEYNVKIKELCVKNNKRYIDFNSVQKKEINKTSEGKEGRYFIKENPGWMVLDVVLTKYPGLTDYLSKKRHLVTTIDGVHLNTRGASLLAGIVMEEMHKAHDLNL